MVPSVPIHSKPPSQVDPLPCPKYEPFTAIGTEGRKEVCHNDIMSLGIQNVPLRSGLVVGLA